MRTTLQLFYVTPSLPTAPPVPGPLLEVEGATNEKLLQSARSLLKARKVRIRSLSFGANGLIAYVEKSE
jgi:hypothetical protein